jgi:hypothetical protein
MTSAIPIQLKSAGAIYSIPTSSACSNDTALPINYRNRPKVVGMVSAMMVRTQDIFMINCSQYG